MGKGMHSGTAQNINSVASDQYQSKKKKISKMRFSYVYDPSITSGSNPYRYQEKNGGRKRLFATEANRGYDTLAFPSVFHQFSF